MRAALRLLSLLLLCLLPAGAAATEQGAGEGDRLIGLWAAELDYGPALRGELTLSRRGAAWTARIMEQRHAFAADGQDVRFSLPGGSGGFRGRLADDESRIEGFWTQPSGETEDRRDPGGSGQPFATPLTLTRAGGDVWRGTVVPLDDRFTLYLKIFRQDDRLVGAFRNPELNSNGGASRFEVTRSGEAVRFNLRYDGGEISHDATLLPDPDRLRISWPDLGREIELTRRTPGEAAAFSRVRPASRLTSIAGRRRPGTDGGRRAPPTPGSTRRR